MGPIRMVSVNVSKGHKSIKECLDLVILLDDTDNSKNYSYYHYSMMMVDMPLMSSG